MNNELYHHGVLGMRCRRRRGEGTVKVTRKQLKQAQKAAKEEVEEEVPATPKKSLFGGLNRPKN